MKFLEAIKIGKNVKELEELDEKDQLEDINFQEGSTGKTALHYATEAGDKQIIDFLLQQSSCRFRLSDKTGRTPLTSAVTNNRMEIVEHLLSNKKFSEKAIDEADGKKETALHIAVAMGNLEMVKLLIEKGADPTINDKTGRSLLTSAVTNNRMEIVEHLLSNKKFSEKAIDEADGKKETALYIAVAMGNLEMVKLLIEKGADPTINDKTGRSLLTSAVANNRIEIVEHLLSNKKFSEKAIDEADGKKETALHIAVAMGNLEMVKLLIEKSADPNQSIEGGVTPLMYAVRYKKKEIVEFLLKNPAVLKEINTKTKGGDTALSLSYSDGDPEIFSLLIKVKNIDLSISREDGATPLMYAVSQGQKESVKLILSKGSLVDSRDNNGNTALLLSINKIDLEMISLLLEHNSDPCIQNKEEIAFIDLLDAESDLKNESEKKKIAEILLKYSIRTMNAKAIFRLKENPIYKEVYEKFYEFISPEERERLDKIMTIKKDDVDFFTKRIIEFGVGFGSITYEGGLLTALQVSKRKGSDKEQSYIFNPTILNKGGEFSEYLECIKKSKKVPLRERFVIAGSHWICGDILIDKNNQVYVLFIDSMGMEDNSTLFSTTKNAIFKFKEKFTTANIYLDKTLRQRSSAGCSVYALDDVRHLYTIEKYLEPKYRETGLFGYLSDNQREKIQIKRFSEDILHLNNVPLPIPFMRTTQSSLLYKDKDKKGEGEVKGKKEKAIISSRSLEEQSQPLGKNKGTAKALQTTLMKEGFKRKSGFLTETNERLRDKLESMCEYNFDCLLNSIHNQEEFYKNTYEFTLEGFKKRMSLAATESSVRIQTVSTPMESNSRPLHYSYSLPSSTLTPEEIRVVSLIKGLKEEINREDTDKEKVEQFLSKIEELQKKNPCNIDKLIPGNTDTIRDLITSIRSELIRDRVFACFQKQSLDLGR